MPTSPYSRNFVPRTVLAASVVVLAVAGTLAPGPAHATAGFAEWEVYTPGGHLISHNDIWKPEHGTCLRSDAQPDAGEAEIYVSHLVRWRYYRDHVVGESAQGFFIFDERDSELIRLESEAELVEAMDERGLGEPETEWLAGADGWQEAWFPFMVWRPCRVVLDGEEIEPDIAGSPEEAEQLRKVVSGMFTEEQCRAALGRTRLELYRRTTWGRICNEWAEQDAAKASVEFPYLQHFCDEIRAAR